MNADDISQAVVDRLKLHLPTFKVEHFPDAPDRYPFTAQHQTLLVTYERSAFGEPETLAPLSVMRTIELSVTTLVRSMRGAQGVQATLQRIRRALFGWRLARRESVSGPGPSDPPTVSWVPLGGTPLLPIAENFVSEDNGVWRFVTAFRTAFPEVAFEPPVPVLAEGPITTIESDTP